MLAPRLLALTLAVLAASPAAGEEADEALAQARRALDERRPDEARRLVAPFAKGRDAEALQLLGRVEFEARNADAALEAFDRAREIEPRQARHHWWYGRACQLKVNEVAKLFQLRWAKRMRKAFERAVELEPDSPEYVYALVRFHREAPGIAGGDRDEAYAQARTLASLDPALGEPALASMLREDGRHAEAAEHFERALVATPESKGLRYNWALSLADAGRAEESFSALEPLLQGAEPDPIALYLVGRTAAVTGSRLDDGRQALARYLETEPPEAAPSKAAAHWRLGNLSEHAGELDAARASYRSALELDPGFEEAEKSLAALPKP